MPVDTTNTLFRYLYRNANNIKDHGKVIFEGSPTEELERRLRAALSDGQYFYHDQLDLPNLATWRAAGWQECCTTLEHVWHELRGLEPTSEAPTEDRSIEDLVQQVEAIGPDGWNTPSLVEELGGLSALEAHLNASHDLERAFKQCFPQGLSKILEEGRLDLLVTLVDAAGSRLPEIWHDHEQALDADTYTYLINHCGPEARRTLYRMSRHLTDRPDPQAGRTR